MPCDHPIWVFSGVHAADHNQERVPVPCGRCPPCKKRRVDQWTFRLLQEEKQHQTAHFITLTFDTRFVPISKNGFMTLRRGYKTVPRKKPAKDGSLYKAVSLCDFTNFLKRLRKLMPKDTKIKYYYCGEYGTHKKRPHYHAIIFGVPDPELYAKAWAVDGSSLGAVHIGTVTGDSIAYTMKYIDKSNWKPLHARDDRTPEFSSMSKGLGLSYLTPAMVKYHKQDLTRLYCTKKQGYRVALPRYYKDRIYTKAEQKLQHPLIESAVQKSLDQERFKFESLYGNTSLSFEEYKERQKLGSNSLHIKKQKSREI